MSLYLGMQGWGLHVYRNQNDSTRFVFGGHIQTIYKYRRFVLDKTVYPDCEKQCLANLVEDFNLLFGSAGYAIKRKQLPKETQDRQGLRFRLCCSENTKKNKCSFHFTLIYFADHGWCITLKNGQPRGTFEHTCIEIVPAEAIQGNDNASNNRPDTEGPGKTSKFPDPSLSKRGKASAKSFPESPCNKFDCSPFGEGMETDELNRKCAACDGEVVHGPGSSEFHEPFNLCIGEDLLSQDLELELTNHHTLQDSTHDERCGATKTPAPSTTSQVASRVVTPESEKQSRKVPQLGEDNFIPLPFSSEKPHSLKNLPKPSPNSSEGLACARSGFQSPIRPQVDNLDDRPLSPPVLQNYTRTSQGGISKWSPISLHQESPPDTDNCSMVPHDRNADLSPISSHQGLSPDIDDCLTILNFFLSE